MMSSTWNTSRKARLARTKYTPPKPKKTMKIKNLNRKK